MTISDEMNFIIIMFCSTGKLVVGGGKAFAEGTTNIVVGGGKASLKLAKSGVSTTANAAKRTSTLIVDGVSTTGNVMMGGTKMVVKGTVKGTSKVVIGTVKGTSMVAIGTVKGTGKVVRSTGRKLGRAISLSDDAAKAKMKQSMSGMDDSAKTKEVQREALGYEDTEDRTSLMKDDAGPQQQQRGGGLFSSRRASSGTPAPARIARRGSNGESVVGGTINSVKNFGRNLFASRSSSGGRSRRRASLDHEASVPARSKTEYSKSATVPGDPLSELEKMEQFLTYIKDSDPNKVAPIINNALTAETRRQSSMRNLVGPSSLTAPKRTTSSGRSKAIRDGSDPEVFDDAMNKSSPMLRFR